MKIPPELLSKIALALFEARLLANNAGPEEVKAVIAEEIREGEGKGEL